MATLDEAGLDDNAGKTAISSLQRLAEVRTSFSALETGLSLYASNGNFDQAIERYQKSLQAEMSAEQLNNFIWTLMEADRLDDAYQESFKALERYPSDNRLQSTLAVVEYKRGNREIALGLFEKVQGAASAYHNIAVLDIDAGNPDAARQSLELAVKMSAKPNPMTVELLEQLNEYAHSTAAKTTTYPKPLLKENAGLRPK